LEDITWRPLVPAALALNIFPSVAVDVAKGVAVAALRADHDRLQRRLAVDVLGEAVDDLGLLLVPGADINLRAAVAIEIVQRDGLVLSGNRAQHVPFPGVFVVDSAGILIPTDFLVRPAHRNHIDPPVAVDIEGMIARVLQEFIVEIGGQIEHRRDVTHGPGNELRSGVPVLTGNDVGFAVLVHVGHRTAFVHVDDQAALRELHRGRLGPCDAHGDETDRREQRRATAAETDSA